MQLTLNFILLTVALAYGGATVSALPAGGDSLAARSEYEDGSVLQIREPPRAKDASDPESNRPHFSSMSNAEYQQRLNNGDFQNTGFKPAPANDEGGEKTPKRIPAHNHRHLGAQGLSKDEADRRDAKHRKDFLEKNPGYKPRATGLRPYNFNDKAPGSSPQ